MRLSDVGDVAGVQAPAIYYHFSNKEELAGDVFVSGFANARTTLERCSSNTMATTRSISWRSRSTRTCDSP